MLDDREVDIEDIDEVAKGKAWDDEGEEEGVAVQEGGHADLIRLTVSPISSMARHKVGVRRLGIRV